MKVSQLNSTKHSPDPLCSYDPCDFYELYVFPKYIKLATFFEGFNSYGHCCIMLLCEGRRHYKLSVFALTVRPTSLMASNWIFVFFKWYSCFAQQINIKQTAEVDVTFAILKDAHPLSQYYYPILIGSLIKVYWIQLISTYLA